MGVFTINVLGLLNPRTFIVLQFCVIAYVEQLILSIGDRLRVCINQDDVPQGIRFQQLRVEPHAAFLPGG